MPRAAPLTIERLAEVLFPPELDAADVHAQTVDKVHSYVTCLPRPTRLALKAALVAFDQGARLYPPARRRRFVDLDRPLADRYLGVLLEGRVGFVRQAVELMKSVVTLCHYDVPEVRKRLGYDPDPHIARRSRTRRERHGEAIEQAEAAVVDGSGPEPGRGGHPAGEITDKAASGELELTGDAVVVGSGAGGATMAAVLADAGIDVVLVEEGGYHPTESFDTDVVGAFRTLYRSGGAQTNGGRPPITYLEGRCVGGSTVVNGGMCWRTPEDVLERWSREEGIDAIRAGDMERHFDNVEEVLSVRAQEPNSIGGDAERLRRGAKALEWSFVRSLRNQLHCAGCDNCLLGCPTGAKRSMLVTNVRRALARGARLVTGCRIGRIAVAGGAATGVEGRFVGPDGRPRGRVVIRAPVVVAACRSLQTTALLARSGLRPRSGLLGRNLSIHPSATLVAIFDEEVRGWEGVHQAYQVTEFLRDGILITASTLPPALIASTLPQRGDALRGLMEDYNRMVVAGCLVEDAPSGRVRVPRGVGPVAQYQLQEGDGRRLVRGLLHTAETMLAAGARRLVLPIEGIQAPLGPDDALRLLRDSVPTTALRPFTVHAMGTARMSGDPERGVVCSYGELYDASGVFVADASILPGPIGVNPMETIVALSARNGEWIAENRARYGI